MKNFISTVLGLLTLLVSWFATHRSQIRMAMIVLVVVLMAFSVLAPQLRTLAEDAGGGGH